MKLLQGSRLGSGVLVAVVAAAMMSTGSWLRAQGAVPVLAAPVILGPNVTFTWTAADGATSYILEAGVAPGATQVSLNVGNTTTFSVAAPAVGTYFARVRVLGGAVSNEVPVVVTSMFVPPAAPTNFGAYLNGKTILFEWELGQGGGAPTNMVLLAGTQSGATDIGAIPVPAGKQFAVANVAGGTYFVRLAAQNPGGLSPVSNEVQIDMPSAGGCTAPPARSFTTAAFGTFVQFTYDPLPGALGYQFKFWGNDPGNPLVVNVAPTSTRYSVIGAPLGTFNGTLTTVFACGSQTVGPQVAFTIDGAPPPGPREPNPEPGQRLPLINRQGVIQQLAAERSDLLFQSCAEHGGNNRFMFEAVRRLRAIDNRWGLNWKRGNVGDLSQDIVTYNYGSGSDEGTTNVYIIDIIGGHCGPRPDWAWIDQTQATIDGGTIGRWTLLPYLNAGYPIVSDPQ